MNEQRKVLPIVGIAVASCIALMLCVIGGLYAYNTFASKAEPVQAQTDVGPSWTVTPVTVGGNQEFVVVITQDKNPYEEGKVGRQMSVYEIRSNGTANAELYFVAARLLEYDSKLPIVSGEKTNGKKWDPLEIKKIVDKK